VRVFDAFADHWAVEGELRGGVRELDGARASSSGLPYRQWNGADITAADADLEGVRAYFGDLPWGVRVPVGISWSVGRLLFRGQLMGLAPDALRPVPDVPGLALREALIDDLDAVTAVDAEAFDGDPDVQRLWIGPHLSSPRCDTVIAELAGEPVGTAYTVRSDGRGGPAACLGGVGVVAAARRRGVAAAMGGWLLDRAFAAGATLAHLRADTPDAARVYARIGFEDAGEVDIWVDL
jgi:RimJ/RimL family protein N-acetyltransferase